MATRRRFLTGTLAGIGALVGGCGTERDPVGAPILWW
ncbi:MAG: twin-arginine translocation signal domain-containing protein [Actinomyces graevenitzii]|uniref:Twin-arginine translocation signal domain-containing protein n=1 Tax=Actinomyces graevenitzii TaxID=55565 RepID=A0A9E7DCV8_9ACTO|nr:MAG: twin-arginine translocation signal domain-containing protein [Actinomyces graevenitzii]